jgi:SsrA-binding protein
MAGEDSQSKRRAIATNRRARFEFEILDRFEAGIALVGPEVKSLRAGKANLSDAYAVVRRGEVFLVSAYIAPYEQAGRSNVESRRERKLLLRRAEISRLSGKLAEKGLTLIPLQLYFSNGRAKVELGLCRGRRRYDKRQAIRQRETDRELQRAKRARGHRPR